MGPFTLIAPACAFRIAMSEVKFKLYPPGNPNRRPPAGTPVSVPAEQISCLQALKATITKNGLPLQTLEILLLLCQETVLKSQLQGIKRLIASYGASKNYKEPVEEWALAIKAFAHLCFSTTTEPLLYHVLNLLQTIATQAPGVPLLALLQEVTEKGLTGSPQFINPSGVITFLGSLSRLGKGGVGQDWLRCCRSMALVATGQWLETSSLSHTSHDVKALLAGLTILLRQQGTPPNSELSARLLPLITDAGQLNEVAVLAAQSLVLVDPDHAQSLSKTLTLINRGPLDGISALACVYLARGLLLELPTVLLADWDSDDSCALLKLWPVLQKGARVEGGARMAALQGLATWILQVSKAVDLALDSGDTTKVSLWTAALQGPNDLCRHILDVVWANWLIGDVVAPMQCRQIVQTLLAMMQKLGGEHGLSAHNLPLNHMLQTDWSKKAKYEVLGLFLPIIGAQALLGLFPRLPQVIVQALGTGSSALVQDILVFIELFNDKLITEYQADGFPLNKSISAIIDLWAIVLLQGLEGMADHQQLILLQYLLLSLLKLGPEAGPLLIAICSGGQAAKPRANNCLHTVALLLALQTQGIPVHTLLFGPSHPPVVLGATHSQVLVLLTQALVHPCTEVILAACSLVCKAPLAASPVTHEETRLVQWLLTHNMSHDSAAFRHDCVALIRTLVARVRISSRNPATPSYTAFVPWLVEISLGSLYPGAPYGRTTMALQLLGVVASDWGLDEISCHSLVSTVVDCLFSSFGDIRQSAFDLLCQLPSALVNAMKPATLLAQAQPLLQSPRSSDADAAALLLRLLHHCHRENQNLLYTALPEAVGRWSMVDTPARAPCVGSYSFLSSLLLGLRAQIAIGQQSLLIASQKAPMHGLMRAVSYVVNDLDTHDCSDGLGELLREALDCMDAMLDIVRPIITDPSPEGNLPTSVVEAYMQHGGVMTSDAGPLHQVGIACCWQVVQACSLLVVAMLQVLPLDCPQACESLLPQARLANMGERFLTMLLETVHVGAFEQAKNGFEAVFKAWGASALPRLRSAPLAWVEQTLAAVEGQASTTRRSAGLPFVLVCGALYLSPLHGFDLSSLVQRLSLTALRPLSQDPAKLHNTHLPQVHALAILRALCRDSRLASILTGQLEGLVLLAMQAYQSTHWSVRSAATMLLGALLGRIFGPPGPGSGGWCKGTLSGRRFFQDYPRLHAYMLGILGRETMAHPPSLYPMLALLCRLLPSSQDSHITQLSPKSLQPGVLACSSSPIEMTRLMAAQALVPLVSSSMVPSLVSQLLAKCSKRDLPSNQVHGILLQVCALLRTHLNMLDPVEFQVQLISSAAVGLQACLWRAAPNYPCRVISVLVLDLLQMLLQGAHQGMPCHEITGLTDLQWLAFKALPDHMAIYTQSQPNTISNHLSLGASVFAGALARICITMATINSPACPWEGGFWGLVDELLHSWSPAVVLAALDAVTNAPHLQGLPATILTTLTMLVIKRPTPQPDIMRGALNILMRSEVLEVKCAPNSTIALATGLRELIEGSSCHNKRAAEMAIAAGGIALIDMQDCVTLSDSQQASMDWWLTCWEAAACETQSIDMRSSVIAALKGLPGLGQHPTTMVRVWILVHRLLQDDNYGIREDACNLATHWLQ
eukprot:Ihof_evm2s367 gene=Ihof_evmTU2s367